MFDSLIIGDKEEQIDLKENESLPEITEKKAEIKLQQLCKEVAFSCNIHCKLLFI